LFNQEIDLRLPLSQSFIAGLPDRADGRAKVDGARGGISGDRLPTPIDGLAAIAQPSAKTCRHTYAAS
jgi:hypothetical protein